MICPECGEDYADHCVYCGECGTADHSECEVAWQRAQGGGSSDLPTPDSPTSEDGKRPNPSMRLY